ncbi:hypothetical protein M434DRAFT_197061 [Hypoxylon sp. CO27-5]|nr:hypothetical protein M434DRAFT_197061 [Hypoxylon sp. CO27-5]
MNYCLPIHLPMDNFTKPEPRASYHVLRISDRAYFGGPLNAISLSYLDPQSISSRRTFRNPLNLKTHASYGYCSNPVTSKCHFLSTFFFPNGNLSLSLKQNGQVMAILELVDTIVADAMDERQDREDDLKLMLGNIHQRLKPLVKYLDSLGLNRRLVGLQWDQGDLSLAYFGRCVAATGRFVAFTEPSLDCVQCYVLMTLYLLDAGEHRSAYNIIGLALRIAQTLNLHH